MKRFLTFLLFSIISVSLFAENSWKEVQVIEIPKGTTIYYRYADDGDIKYYFKFDDLIVSVSKTNAKKFIEGTVRLELVKWQHRSTYKFKYTVRQIQNSSKDIDLSKIFL